MDMEAVGRPADPEAEEDQEPRPGPGPSVLRLLLGCRLRRLREEAGVSPERAGHAIRASPSKISRMELGRSGFKRRDVADLLHLYGVAEDAVETTLELVRQAGAPPWWQEFADVVPEGFGDFLDMEQAAVLLRVYTSQHVPALLQTPDYARALIHHSHPGATFEENRMRLELRMRRQELVQREDGPRLWTIVDEAALLRRVGGSAVMRRQLLHLKEVADRRTHTLQVMPLSGGAYSANGAPLALLRFRETELPDMVYLEHLTGGQYLNKPVEFDRYWDALNTLAIDARPPAATAGFLTDVLRHT